MSDFSIGQPVQRVSPPSSHDSRFLGARKGMSFPKLYERVHIRTIEETRDGTLLTFREHDNKRFINWPWLRYEPAFPARHFRAAEEVFVEPQRVQLRLVSDNTVTE